jgi:hypothetical protein
LASLVGANGAIVQEVESGRHDVSPYSVSRLAQAIEHFYVADPISQARREIEREGEALELPNEIVNGPLSAHQAREEALQRGTESALLKMATIYASESVVPVESAVTSRTSRLALAEAAMRAQSSELERIESALRLQRREATERPPALQELGDQLEQARRMQRQASQRAALDEAEEAARQRAEMESLRLTLADARKKSADVQTGHEQRKVAPSALALARERYEILNDESRRLQAEATIVACTLASERCEFLEVQHEEEMSRWEIANSLAHGLAKEATETERRAKAAALKLDDLEESQSQEDRMAELLQRQERLRKKRSELAGRPIDDATQQRLRAGHEIADLRISALELSTRSDIEAQMHKRKAHIESVCNARLAPQAERNATLADEHMNKLVEEKRRHLAKLLEAKQTAELSTSLDDRSAVREEWRSLLPAWSRHCRPPSPEPPLAAGPFSCVLPRVRVGRTLSIQLRCVRASAASAASVRPFQFYLLWQVIRDALHTPTEPGWVRFVCLADTLGQHSSVPIIPADVLLFAGNLTNSGGLNQIAAFASWLEDYPAARKVLVAGSQDVTFDAPFYTSHWRRFHLKRQEAELALPTIQACRNAIYLENTSAAVAGIHVFGSPFSVGPLSTTGAFAGNAGQWARIPEDVDILVTHGAAIKMGPGYSPAAFTGASSSALPLRPLDDDLLTQIQQRVIPAVHVCGNAAREYGVTTDGTTLFVNACICKPDLQATNSPIVFDMRVESDLEREARRSELLCSLNDQLQNRLDQH